MNGEPVTPPSSNERDPLIAALYLLKGQAQSPIHCETAGRAIHEIEHLTRERDEAKADASTWLDHSEMAERERDRLSAKLRLQDTALRLIKAGPPLRMANDAVASWAAFIASEALSGEPSSAHETKAAHEARDLNPGHEFER